MESSKCKNEAEADKYKSNTSGTGCGAHNVLRTTYASSCAVQQLSCIAENECITDVKVTSTFFEQRLETSAMPGAEDEAKTNAPDSNAGCKQQHLDSSQEMSDSITSLEPELSSIFFGNDLVDSDELPAFEIRLVSPMGRTPSPIDSEVEHDATPVKRDSRRNSCNAWNTDDFVALHDINAQISPPKEGEELDADNSKNLETIFEGVFLQTPPRQRNNRRSFLLEKAAINRSNNCNGKENTSPVRADEALPKQHSNKFNGHHTKLHLHKE